MSLFRLEVTNKFPPYSCYRMRSVLTMLRVEAETWAQFVQLTDEYLFNQDSPSSGRKKAIVHGLNSSKCSSCWGNLILGANVAGWSRGCHSIWRQVFSVQFSLVNSTAWENIFIPSRPIVHNAHHHQYHQHQQHTQHTAHERTRQEEGERGGEHSVGRSRRRSTDRDKRHRRVRNSHIQGNQKCWEKEES